MECSPLPPPPIPSLATKIPLKEIAQRLANSLHPEELFPETSYLKNVKAELRKLMKQRYIGQLVSVSLETKRRCNKSGVKR